MTAPVPARRRPGSGADDSAAPAPVAASRRVGATADDADARFLALLDDAAEAFAGSPEPLWIAWRQRARRPPRA